MSLLPEYRDMIQEQPNLYGELWIFVLIDEGWMKFMEIVELKGEVFCFGRVESKVSGEDLIWVKLFKITIYGNWVQLWEQEHTSILFLYSFYRLISCTFVASFSGYNSHFLDIYKFSEIPVICVLELFTFPTQSNKLKVNQLPLSINYFYDKFSPNSHGMKRTV